MYGNQIPNKHTGKFHKSRILYRTSYTTEAMDDYQASPLVLNVHELPHLNERLEIVDSSFHITFDSKWNSYTKSLIPLPAVIGISAVLG